MDLIKKAKNVDDLRVIKTARTEKSINIGARMGLKPLVKKVVASDKIKTMFTVYQHEETREVKVVMDARAGIKFEQDEAYTKVIERTFYYPYSFKSPFAAYLIPSSLKVGEKVFVQDLIEDYVGLSWNQGSAYRLESCAAIWTGSDLEILYDEGKDITKIMG